MTIRANKLKIKKGDQVIILAGKDKGKKGEVLKTFPNESRVIVAGVNIIKKHRKPNKMEAGGIVSKEAAIHISNVAIADPKSGKPSKIGFQVLKDGKKVRIARKSGETIG